jgi:ubiquinol-cytochrome c reductase cytochrome b subunit
MYLVVYRLLVNYPTPNNLSFLWNFGSLSGVMLFSQILSGLFLSMHYSGHIDLAFFSIDRIMNEIPAGWFVRYLHSNGASMFFFVVYLHIFRGIYYGSYRSPRSVVWLLGVIIFVLLMGTAFLGYVLPWGQMSFWAATVITNFVTVLPYVGKDLLEWIWGGFSINNATLARFYSLHYLFPFILLGLVFLHIMYLHMFGSSNPVGFNLFRFEKSVFYPYFYTKDLFGLSCFLFLFSFFVFFFPEVLGHSDNYVEANPMVTPSHIVPEWYFLPFYAILRSIPHKALGIFAMFFSILVLAALPYIDRGFIRSGLFRPVHQKFFWFFLFCLLLLGYLGSQAPVYPFITVGMFVTNFYFFLFLVMPIYSFFESHFFSVFKIRFSYC